MNGAAGGTYRPRGAAVRRGLLWLGVLGLAVVAAIVVAARHRGGSPAGLPAPAFTLPNLQGQMTSLASLAPTGNVVIRFGSVNCTICDPDWSVLARWQSQPGAPRIVAVEVGEPLSVVQVRLGGGHYAVPVLVDASGAVAAEYGVRGLPAFAFIDRQERIVAVRTVVTRTGIWPQSTWERFVQRLQRADAAAA